MYNIGRNVTSVIFVESAKISIARVRQIWNLFKYKQIFCDLRKMFFCMARIQWLMMSKAKKVDTMSIDF